MPNAYAKLFPAAHAPIASGGLSDACGVTEDYNRPFPDFANAKSAQVISGLQAGDILHVSLGMDMGEGSPPWTPGPAEIADAHARWLTIVPGGVKVVVTHMGEKVEIIKKGRA